MQQPVTRSSFERDELLLLFLLISGMLVLVPPIAHFPSGIMYVVVVCTPLVLRAFCSTLARHDDVGV